MAKRKRRGHTTCKIGYEISGRRGVVGLFNVIGRGRTQRAAELDARSKALELARRDGIEGAKPSMIFSEECSERRGGELSFRRRKR